MAKIDVTVRRSAQPLGTHPKYGPLKAGQKLTIDEADFGDQLFERPSGFVSPKEKKDAARAAELGKPVGGQQPPVKKAEKTKEVTDA